MQGKGELQILQKLIPQASAVELADTLKATVANLRTQQTNDDERANSKPVIKPTARAIADVTRGIVTWVKYGAMQQTVTDVAAQQACKELAVIEAILGRVRENDHALVQVAIKQLEGLVAKFPQMKSWANNQSFEKFEEVQQLMQSITSKNPWAKDILNNIPREDKAKAAAKPQEEKREEKDAAAASSSSTSPTTTPTLTLSSSGRK